MPTFYSFDRAHAKLYPASLPAISRRLAIPLTPVSGRFSAVLCCGDRTALPAAQV